MKVPIAEFDFSFSRSSGAGGQNVNKLNTKVTLTWDIIKSKSVSEAVKKRFEAKFSRFISSEGIVQVISQRFRSQPRNIADCTEKLHLMLEKVARPPKARVKTKVPPRAKRKRLDDKKNKSEVKKKRQKVSY
ncbi:MAG: aminoacyl-tRNA hydrolase [Halobacteriovoraceae bacterium]|jgi:ribosome-associated protein|nr:aminoacyl-tRNA hydrolase [Halobacteriovoraceae bacterium]MBT5092624.1 aminoacyl-tRNA hydrolase [Halobacteriovoraceae bacterium]